MNFTRLYFFWKQSYVENYYLSLIIQKGERIYFNWVSLFKLVKQEQKIYYK